LKEFDTSDLIKILIAAGELSLQELITYLQSFLIENEKNWMEENFDFVYQASFKNDLFLDLQKFCTDLITKEPDKIFKSPNFLSVSEKLLVSIIQSDNLQISEIQIWEHVLKWGLAQNPELPPDITNYSKDDFKILKNTLQQFIPFIRFYNLTSKEFLDKVFPYREILPEELHIDLLKTFLSLSDPNSMPTNKSNPRISKVKLITIDSKIITHHHAELILKWINRLGNADNLTTQYEFKLLFRGSHDGLTREKFHELCDNHSHTVTIVKVEDSDEILGGYNPIEWKSSGGFKSTKNSFIFSFKNADKIENHILSRVVSETNAVHNCSFSGPKFGKSDLIIFGGYSGNCCVKLYYEKPIRETEYNFSVEECEVFQVI
jgi:hypothetical protein